MADVQRLSTFLQLEPAVVEGHDWSKILPALLARASEFESLKSRNIVLEVEVEQANIQSEKRVAAAAEEVQSVRKQLSESAGNGQQNDSRTAELQAQNAAVTSERNKLQATIDTQLTQLTSLSEEKRQALVLLDRQSQAGSRHEEEYKSLLERYQTLRKDSVKLEAQVSEAQSTASAARYKCNALEQSLDLANNNADFLTSELEVKTKQFANYRKENGELLATIQKESDEAKAEAASAEHSAEQLRQKNQELSASLDQSLVRVSELQEQLTIKEESFRSEMSTQLRLIELHERSAKAAKTRIQQLERSLDARSNVDPDELVLWRQRAQSSEERLHDLERQIANLSEETERLEAELEIANQRLETDDRQGSNGIAILSPSAQLLSKAQNSGMSLTQLYAEFLKTKQDLEHEKRKNVKIQGNFDSLIVELESRAPQLQQQREEYSSLQIELASMSENMQSVTERNEALVHELQVVETRSKDQSNEIQLFEKQVADLSRQIQTLLFEIEEQGFRSNPLSESEVNALNSLLQNGQQSNSAVDNLISDRLVLFKNIQDLQRQNMQQLKVTRQLGAKMEREEEETRRKLNNIESSALEEAQTTITKLNSQLESMEVKVEAHIRERAMFRSMLTSASTRLDGTTQIPAVYNGSSTDHNESAEAIKTEFEIYKKEILVDQKAMADELAAVRKERSDLSLQVARLSAQLELSEERHKMIAGSLDMMKREVEESRKRNLQIQENLAKQDSRVQHQTEDLVETKAIVNSLRNENANYKAEKQLWKSIEQRLTEESNSVRTERDRLNTLVANLQAMQNERDRTEGELVQRYGHQISALESDIEAVKVSLAAEREEVRRMTLNKDQTTRESQEKVETLLRQVSDAREAQAIANSEKDSHKARVTELDTQIRALQEKLSIYTSIPQVSGRNSSDTTQQSQLDIVELREALEHSKADIQQAKDQAHQMELLAKNAEEALQSINESYDAYKTAMEQDGQLHVQQVTTLERNLADMTEQLSSVNLELSQIHKSEAEKRQSLQQEVESLKALIVSLREVEEKYTIASSFYQDDLRAQAEIAQEAQQNYENELLRHAEAAQSLRSLRSDYDELRTEVLTLRQESSGAEKLLADETQSWQTQRESYERELSEMRSRLTELRHQNELLHNQFESFSANQLAYRTEQDSATSVTDSDPEGVQEVVKYLRREKEIAEMSTEVLQQESKRLRQELVHTTKTLDDVQQALSVERQKAAQATLSSTSEAETRAKMNELAMVRESNGALRADNEANIKKIRALEASFEDVRNKIEPLENRIRIAEAEIASKNEEISLLTETNDRWRQRNEAILQKYDRIDPGELQQLREQANGANEQLTQLQATIAAHEAQLQEREASNTSLQEQLNNQISKYDSLMQQSRDRIRKERADAKTALASAQTAASQLDSQSSEIESLKKEIEELKNSAASESSSLGGLRADVERLESLVSEKTTAEDALRSSLNDEIKGLQSSITSLTTERDEARQSLTTTDENVAHQAELEKSKAELENQKKQYKELRQAAKRNKDDLTAKVAELETQLEHLKSEQSTTEAAADEDSIQRRIDEAVAAARSEQANGADASGTDLPSDDSAIQSRIAEALAQQEETNKVETQRLIAEALEKQSQNHVGDSSDAAPHDEKVEAMLKAKDEECKAKIRSITKEKVDAIVETRLPKKIEAEKQSWQREAEEEKTRLVAEKKAELDQAMKELEEKNAALLETRLASVRKESDMRNQLKISMKDKKIAQLEKSIADLTASAAQSPAQEKEATATVTSTTASAAASPSGNNGKSPDIFDDTSEHSEGDVDDGQVSSSEAATTATTGAAKNGTAATAPTGVPRSRIARGGKSFRGAKRGGLQGTKRPREDGASAEGEQPAKKAA